MRGFEVAKARPASFQQALDGRNLGGITLMVVIQYFEQGGDDSGGRSWRQSERV